MGTSIFFSNTNLFVCLFVFFVGSKVGWSAWGKDMCKSHSWPPWGATHGKLLLLVIVYSWISVTIFSWLSSHCLQPLLSFCLCAVHLLLEGSPMLPVPWLWPSKPKGRWHHNSISISVSYFQSFLGYFNPDAPLSPQIPRNLSETEFLFLLKVPFLFTKLPFYQQQSLNISRLSLFPPIPTNC